MGVAIMGFGVFLPACSISSQGDTAYSDALKQAGSNRAELEKAVEHYAAKDDRQKADAARFLIANMPGFETRSFDLISPKNEILEFSLYQRHITAKNYREVLDSLGARIRPRLVSDVEAISSDYLIRNIDQAFDAWRSYEWSRGYSEELFREYILPHRVDTEDLSDWRTFFIERYRPMIDTMSAPRTVRNVAALIIRDVNSWLVFSYDALMPKPAMTPVEAYGHGLGECGNIADIFVLALRSMGIAAAKDVIPVWGSSYAGHTETMYFDENGNPVLVHTGNPLGASPVRVYRMRYSLGATCDSVAGDPRYEDVTAQYVAVSDVTLAIDLWSTDTSGPGFLAMAVYGSDSWRPAVSASGSRKVAGAVGDTVILYDFKGLGRGVIYYPVWMYGDGSWKSVSDPVCLDARGNISYILPDRNHPVDMDLTYEATPSQQTMLVRPQDVAEFNPRDYVLLYWSSGGWVEHPAPVAQSRGTGGQPVFTIPGVPSGTFYRLWNPKANSNFRNRPFMLYDDRFERY